MYWEIWGEPENPPLWSGTQQEYFDLYTVTANHLKKSFPNLKIGGYGSCGFYCLTQPENIGVYFEKSYIPFLEDFLKHISSSETKAPLDFFSWHCYNDDPNELVIHSEYAEKILKKYGFNETENILDEWNFIARPHNGDIFPPMRSIFAACYVGGALCELQKSSVDLATYYDAQPCPQYGGIFEFYTTTPSKPYYAMKAFNELYKLGNELKTFCDDSKVHVCAATDGNDLAIMICNRNDSDVVISIDFEQPPHEKKLDCFVLDKERNLEFDSLYDFGCKNMMSLKANALLILKT